MKMTPERWDYTAQYIKNVFGDEDSHLASLMKNAIASGLPDIAVSPAVGQLLMMLTSMTRGRLAIEVGTLGGYSGIWIARGLQPAGRLITIEFNPMHAAFARKQFTLAGVSEKVEVREGAALDVLPKLARELPPQSVEVVFLDAVKEEYPQYWELVRPLVAPGGLIVADNVCGSNTWWIDEAGHPARDAADRFNRMVADDPEFEAVAVPLGQGVLIGRRAHRAS